MLLLLSMVEWNQVTHCKYTHAAVYAIGAVRSDRQVMLGNHRDAWVFGAADPNSGTAVLMELARALSQLRENGNIFLI